MPMYNRVFLPNSSQIRGRISKDGGYFQILLKFGQKDAENLGQLRMLCGQETSLAPLGYIHLARRLPIRYLDVYEETLTRLSRRPPFAISLSDPFKAVHSWLSKTSFAISVDYSSPVLSEIGGRLLSAVQDLPFLEATNPYRPSALVTRFVLSNNITDPDDLDRKFEFAQKNYKKGVRTVEALGLSLQFKPYSKQSPPPERPPAKDFLFDGVDEEDVYKENETLSSVENSDTSQSTTSKT